MDRIARQILRSIHTASAMTIIGERHIAWYEYQTETTKLSDARVLALGNGWIGGVHSTRYGQNGAEAITEAQREGLLGNRVRPREPTPKPRVSLSDIIERFESTLPEGILFDPATRDHGRMHGFSSTQRRELFHGAIAYTRNIFDRRQSRHFDVTALITNGKLRLIFGAPANRARKARSSWHAFINTINVSAALGIQIAEENPTVFPSTHKRTLYVAGALVVAVGLCLIPMNHCVTGAVRLRPMVRVEIRAPMAGFLEHINVEQGTRVAAGTVIARLDVPDLRSRIAGKQAGIEAMQAKLRLLQAGPRAERVAVQRELVGLTASWRDQAQRELQQAIKKDVKRVAMKIEEYRARMKLAREEFELSKRLIKAKALQGRELRRAETEHQVWESQYHQAVAEQKANASMVVLRAVSEIVEREQDVAEAQAALTLMEVGNRPEMIDMARAYKKRLEEELAYLVSMETKLELKSPIDGAILTSALAESVGRYYDNGDLILEVADASVLEAEIVISEKYTRGITPGQRVLLKIQAQPFQTFDAEVERISPVVEAGDQAGSAKIYGALKENHMELWPGMSGYARIYLERRPAGLILFSQIMRFIRTEFWW